MEFICAGAVCIGALIMAYSIYSYYKTLRFMQEQTYDRTIFNQRTYGATFFMMIFFFFGYGAVAVRFIFEVDGSKNLLTSAIFFFGAVFVLCVVKGQRLMAETIVDKSKQTIQSMINAMEAKDAYTKGHSEHVRNLSLLLYDHLPDDLKKKVNRIKLSDAAMLHDIGKIGISDYILNKPGKLTEEEFEMIRLHPQNGKAILQNTSYRDIGDWILHHHERVDGNGYYHLPGKEIPLEVRIISLADMFSAMYTERVYQKKSTYDRVIDVIKSEAGGALDPALVDIFCSIDKEKIEDIPSC